MKEKREWICWAICYDSPHNEKGNMILGQEAGLQLSIFGTKASAIEDRRNSVESLRKLPIKKVKVVEI